MTNRVALVSMPFASAGYPAIGISLLRAALERRGIACELHYLNLNFASLLGLERYGFISEELHVSLAGEWVFARTLFGDGIPPDEDYRRRVLLRDSNSELTVETLLSIFQARECAADFLDQCLKAIDWSQYAIVGFTSTFQQTCSSLALARLIKQQHPDTVIVFGGANCEAEMGIELHRQFDFIDFVCSGEGDHNFPELVTRLLRHESDLELDGIIARRNGKTCVPQKIVNPVFDMDALPIPSYDDYFRQFSAQGLKNGHEVLIPFESSRGCWWGAKMHCTFCGLNGSTMTYRSKSPRRLLDEVWALSEKFGRSFVSVDNILDMKYLQNFFPELISRGADFSFHYETKTNLKKPQLKVLRDAGVTHLQPGIESLSTSILKLMKKGCTLLQNVQCLKWCREYGIKVAWNFLYGFPGEDPQEYAQMARLVPFLLHLDPPCYCARVRLDRHSPYFTRPEEYGISNIRPLDSYAYVYPFGQDALKNLAYFFEFDHELQMSVADYTRNVVKEIIAWQTLAHRGTLTYTPRGGEIALLDTRRPSDAIEAVLEEPLSTIYFYCDEARSVTNIQQYLAGSPRPWQMTTRELREALENMVERRWMIREGEHYLSLAISSQPDHEAPVQTAAEFASTR
jgi:ribosomal peptide maturation radical SAM protein 1